MTTYVTYASSLQPGISRRARRRMPGRAWRRIEASNTRWATRLTFAKIDLTAAIFRIERPFANIDPTDNVFKITGQQVNRGLELSRSARLSRASPLRRCHAARRRLQHTPLASTNDKRYVGAAKVKGNMLFEYRIPALPALVATFDYQFSSRRPATTRTRRGGGLPPVRCGCSLPRDSGARR